MVKAVVAGSAASDLEQSLGPQPQLSVAEQQAEAPEQQLVALAAVVAIVAALKADPLVEALVARKIEVVQQVAGTVALAAEAVAAARAVGTAELAAAGTVALVAQLVVEH